GLDYLHSRNIVHGDLRGTNIPISDKGSACLSDFRLAASISDADSVTGLTSSSDDAGSIRWFAPELMSTRMDVSVWRCWLQTLTLLKLYTGSPPFSNVTEVAAMFNGHRGPRM
ncbi:kinase-like domain-containing protein, partial [Mycena vulgaris]